jgi:colicin import membrane protein
MSAELVMGNPEHMGGNRWGIMLTISIILHLSVFSAVLLLPGIIPSKNDDNVVYEVDLVEMPSAGIQTQAPSASNSEAPAEKPDTTAKRINSNEEKKVPIQVIPVKKKNVIIKKEEQPSSKVVEDAISKLKKKVKPEDINHLDNAISKLEKKTKSEENHLGQAMSQLQNKAGGGASKSESSGTGAIDSLAMTIYKQSVKSHIQDNWTYPVAMQNRKDLEVTVSLKIREDGNIMKYEFVKKSGDSNFDQSVLKAIEKSNPIPSFPEGYVKTYDDFEFKFSLKELLDN